MRLLLARLRVEAGGQPGDRGGARARGVEDCSVVKSRVPVRMEAF